MVDDCVNRETVKFLCSYNGKILPRPIDGALRYVGGLTRVLAVDRSFSFAELMVKLGEFCGSSVELRCQLPNGDLETLICVKSDVELSFLIEEYERSCPGSKIRAVLTPQKSIKSMSPVSSVDLSPIKSKSYSDFRRLRNLSPAIGYPACLYKEESGKVRWSSIYGHRNPRFRWCSDPCCYKNGQYIQA